MEQLSCPHCNAENITYSVQGKQIYRDQCLKCYDSPKSPEGLDICLKCFSGYCKSEIFNHSIYHYTDTKHCLVLNIKEVKIDSSSSPENTVITKLAIGKPGGAPLVEDQYSQILTVRCFQCNKEIDYKKIDAINSLVISIMNAASESEKSDIKAWEEKLYPCEHTLTLQQDANIKLAEKSMAKCSECNLSSNLWLCLTCGNLSCGRKETGGNAHAIDHFNKTKHPLVVKTGTITPDGEASIYCYACDNDVIDENLPSHLINFGIDVSTQKKTDKTITEMNLDININLTLSKTIEEGKVLTPLYGPGLTGMENIGNSCYMNSVLQILLSLEPMKKWYFDDALIHLNSCNKNPSDCYLCQMSKIMYGLYSGIYSVKKERTLPSTEQGKPGEKEEYQDGIRPSSFKLFFGKGHAEFSSNRQQDALEYLNFILEKMKREDKPRKIDPLSLFSFEIESRLECQDCHCVKYRKMNQWYLSFSVDDWKSKKDENSKCSMEQCIAKFLGGEEVELNCNKCNKSTKWVKTQRVLNFPKYLILVFERFVFDWVPIKLEVQFQPVIDNFDLNLLARDHSKPGENVIETSQESDNNNNKNEEEEILQEPEFKQDDVNYLLQCGIPELGAKWALFKNNNNPEIAMGWYCENMDNPEIKQPLPKIKSKKSNKNNNNNTDVNMDFLNNLVSMGFLYDRAVFALKKHNNNFDFALEYLFSNTDDIIKDMQESNKENEVKDNDNNNNMEIDKKNINEGNGSMYDLYGYLTHLGKNSEHGHYVCHIRKEGNIWNYFNDLRVNSWENPPIHKGYIYFYRNNKPSSA